MALTYAEQTHANISDLCHSDGIGCDGSNDNPDAEYGNAHVSVTEHQLFSGTTMRSVNSTFLRLSTV